MTRQVETPKPRGGAVKLEWTAPAIRESIPARRSAGGIGRRNDQDDVFYRRS